MTVGANDARRSVASTVGAGDRNGSVGVGVSRSADVGADVGNSPSAPVGADVMSRNVGGRWRNVGAADGTGGFAPVGASVGTHVTRDLRTVLGAVVGGKHGVGSAVASVDGANLRRPNSARRRPS